MKNKLVSVIVPVYNVERYLARCVDSILTQTYQDLEIILVDDGSTDASPEICNQYKGKDNRIRVCHQKNGGLSAARNTGIDMSVGEYIVFVDSDDYIHPQMIECLYNGIVDNQVMMSMCGLKKVVLETSEMDDAYNESEFSICKDTDLLNLYFEDDEKRVMVIVAWNKMYHRDLFLTCRFPEGKLFEDNYTSPRLLHTAGWIAVNDSPLYYYFQREGSISCSRDNVRALQDTYDAFEGIHSFMLTIGDEQLTLKSALDELKWFYAYNRKYSGVIDKEVAACVQKIYNESYATYVSKEKRFSWRVRYWLMRYVPKMYNYVMIRKGEKDE